MLISDSFDLPNTNVVSLLCDQNVPRIRSFILCFLSDECGCFKILASQMFPEAPSEDLLKIQPTVALVFPNASESDVTTELRLQNADEKRTVLYKVTPRIIFF